MAMFSPVQELARVRLSWSKSLLVRGLRVIMTNALRRLFPKAKGPVPFGYQRVRLWDININTN